MDDLTLLFVIIGVVILIFVVLAILDGIFFTLTLTKIIKSKNPINWKIFWVVVLVFLGPIGIVWFNSVGKKELIIGDANQNNENQNTNQNIDELQPRS